jgi:hypothetical protein
MRSFEVLLITVTFLTTLAATTMLGQSRSAKEFLDFKVGDSWSYVNHNVGKPEYSPNYALTIRVDGTSDGFAIVEERTVHDTSVGSRINMFRSDSLGNVYVRIFNFDSLKTIGANKMKVGHFPSDGTSIWYKFNAKVGDTWTAWALGPRSIWGFMEYKLEMLSKSETISFRGRKYSRCVEFCISPLGLSDSDIHEWFAPGVGMVRRSFNQTKSGYYLVDKKSR